MREHVVPGRRKRRLSRAAEDLLASGRFDHLRQPVACREDRVEPLAHEDPATRSTRDEAPHVRQLGLHFLDDGLAALWHPEAARELQHARLDLRNRMRVDRDDLAVERAQRAEVAARDGADRAEILRQDQVRLERGDQVLVDCVERQPVRERVPDRAVDRAAVERARIDPGGRDDRQGARLRRPVALFGDADEGVREPEGAHDLGRARQK